MEFNHADRLWSQLRELIQKEDMLINNWISLLILVNAALIAGLVSVNVTIIENNEKIDLFSLIFILMICMVGFMASGFFMYSLSAAWDQLEYLRRQYDSHYAIFLEFRFTRPFGDEFAEGRTAFLPKLIVYFFGKPYRFALIFVVFWVLTPMIFFGDVLLRRFGIVQ